MIITACNHDGDWMICKECLDKNELGALRAEVERLKQERDAAIREIVPAFTEIERQRRMWADAMETREEFRAERDRLRAEVERLRHAAHEAISRVEPWTTHCDYRAEPNLADAVAILRSALKEQP
jgi:uncharacterized coiled-coil DUF342 family protein